MKEKNFDYIWVSLQRISSSLPRRVYQRMLANDNILRAFRRLETLGIIVCAQRENGM